LWFEWLNDQLDIDILVTIVSLFWVDVVNLKRPLSDLNDFVPQVAELHVGEVLSEFIDRFFWEDGLDEIVSITHVDLRDNLGDEDFEVFVESLWHAHDRGGAGIAWANHLLHIAEMVQIVKNDTLKSWFFKDLTHRVWFKY
jgi:hypothetical protein